MAWILALGGAKWAQQATTVWTPQYIKAGAGSATLVALLLGGRAVATEDGEPLRDKLLYWGIMTMGAATVGAYTGPYWIPLGMAFATGYLCRPTRGHVQ